MRKNYTPLTGNICFGLIGKNLEDRFINFICGPTDLIMIAGDRTVHSEYQTATLQIHATNEKLFISEYGNTDDKLNIECYPTDDPIIINEKPVTVYASMEKHLTYSFSVYYPNCKGRCGFNRSISIYLIAKTLKIDDLPNETHKDTIRKIKAIVHQRTTHRLQLVWAKRKGYGIIATLPMDIIRMLCGMLRLNIDWKNSDKLPKFEYTIMPNKDITFYKGPALPDVL